MFRGPYWFLSNFYPVDVTLYVGNKPYVFPTSEHAYAAFKSTDPDDWYRFANSPLIDQGRDAKREGRKLNVRSDWDQVKLRHMKVVVSAKFHQNNHMMLKLRSTGNATLIEGNTHGDDYWGICNRKGHNHLGNILMGVRDGTLTL